MTNLFFKSKVLHIFRSIIHQPITSSGPFSGSLLLAVGPSTQTCTDQKLGTDFFCHQPKFEMHLPAIPEEETPEILTTSCSPTCGVKSASPNCKRVSPPHHGFGSSATWRSRKLILRSVPPFPSLNSPCEDWLLNSLGKCSVLWRRGMLRRIEFELIKGALVIIVTISFTIGKGVQLPPIELSKVPVI